MFPPFPRPIQFQNSSHFNHSTIVTQQNIDSIVVQGKPIYHLAYKTVKDLHFSENIEWTNKQVKEARKNKLIIQPSLLLARFKQTDIENYYHCRPLAQWPGLSGKSSINFENGLTDRNWDLKPHQDLNNVIGIFPLNLCFNGEKKHLTNVNKNRQKK